MRARVGTKKYSGFESDYHHDITSMSSALDASLYVGKINLDGDDVTFLQALFFEARFVSQAFGHQLKSGMHSKLDINTYTPTLCV